MIICKFEKGYESGLRHLVTHALCFRNEQILLVKRSNNLPEGGKWALPGGFLDRDETVFEGVLRELLEETGWTGKIAGLLRINSNPYRAHEDRQNVAFDFLIKPLEKTGLPDAESSAVSWFKFKDVNPSQLAFDHGETFKLFSKYCHTPFPIPVVV